MYKFYQGLISKFAFYVRLNSFMHIYLMCFRESLGRLRGTSDLYNKTRTALMGSDGELPQLLGNS